METDKTPREQYKDAIVNVQGNIKQLLQFLQRFENVKISNADYMKSYSSVQRACDSSSNPTQFEGITPLQEKDKMECESEFFQYFQNELKEYLRKDERKLSEIQDHEIYVKNLNSMHKNFVIFLNWLYKMFQYLDRFHLKNKGTDLQSEGFKIYRIHFWDKLKDNIFRKVIHFQIDMLRSDCEIPRDEIHNIIRIYSLIGFQKKAKLEKNSFGEYYLVVPEAKDSEKYYEDNFQKELANEIEKFYVQKVTIWNNLSSPEYVSEALKALKKEEDIADEFYAVSKTRIIQIIEQTIIYNTAEHVCNNEQTGVMNMLVNSHENYLKDIYSLFKRVRQTLSFIARKLVAYLEDLGNGYNNECEQKKKEKSQKDIALDYVKSVFQLRAKSEDLVLNIFSNDIDLQKARDNAFQTFLNKNDKTTFFLAMHCDNLMKSESFSNENEMEDKLIEIIKIFGYLYARDAFFKHYQKFFCNRLLNTTSKNRDAEKAIMAKFKTEAGNTAIQKIQTMLQDVNLAEELVKETEPLLKNTKIDLQALVLTNGCWPLTQSKDKVNIPEALKGAVKVFEGFYHKKYPGRNIYWLYSQGFADVIFQTVKKERFILLVSTYQLLILLTIEQSGERNYGSIQEVLGINEEDFKTHIQALVAFKILQCEDEVKNKKYLEVGKEDQIFINDKYTNKSKRVKCLPQARKKGNEPTGPTTDPDIEKERECIVDATLVRIMKGRRVLPHNDLVQDTVKLINLFKADFPLIKRRIESLIERDYLKRDEKSRNTYHYIP